MGSHEVYVNSEALVNEAIKMEKQVCGCLPVFLWLHGNGGYLDNLGDVYMFLLFEKIPKILQE